jgi:Uri superfamily endonuclease
LHQKQQKTMVSSEFTLFGNNYRMGSYLLFINLSKPVQLAFGMFQRGKLFTISEGDYIYIGSALGEVKSGSPLARRVIRHTLRTSGKPHHRIRESMMNLFSEKNFTGNKEITSSTKKLHWHIDYLLDIPEAEIIHIVIIRSPLRIEQKLSELLEQLDDTSLIAPRLGAQDMKNSTHILKLTNRKRILEVLHNHIPGMIGDD